MLAKPSLNLFQGPGGDHRGGHAQPGWRTFMMTCLRWILGYTRLEIWCKIGLSGDWCLCTAPCTRSGACYYWIGRFCSPCRRELLHSNHGENDRVLHNLHCLRIKHMPILSIQPLTHAHRQSWHSRLYPSRSWYSTKRPWRDARLSWPSWLVTYRDGIPARRWSPIQVLTGPDAV